MKALSEATNAQRFEAAVKPVGYDEVTPEEKERIKDIHDFRSKVNGEKFARRQGSPDSLALWR